MRYGNLQVCDRQRGQPEFADERHSVSIGTLFFFGNGLIYWLALASATYSQIPL